jgi:hypothetical protein
VTDDRGGRLGPGRGPGRPGPGDRAGGPAGRLPHTALVQAVAARTALWRGDAPRGPGHLARVARLRPLLTYGLSFFAVQTLLELGRACLVLDDAAGARAALGQAGDVLQQRPDLGDLPGQVRELQDQLERTRGAGRGDLAHHRRVAAAPAAVDPPLVPRDRPAAVCVTPHRQDPGDLALPQARIASRSAASNTHDTSASSEPRPCPFRAWAPASAGSAHDPTRSGAPTPGSRAGSTPRRLTARPG